MNTATADTTARLVAWVSFEVIRPGVAFVAINYVGATDLWSAFRVEISFRGRTQLDCIDGRGVDHLYEQAYIVACQAALVHGYEVERFTRVEA